MDGAGDDEVEDLSLHRQRQFDQQRGGLRWHSSVQEGQAEQRHAQRRLLHILLWFR